jgi:hypothetical protein
MGSELVPERVVEGLRIRTVAGNSSGVEFRTELDYLDIRTESDEARFAREVPGGRNTLLYVLEGQVLLADGSLYKGEAALLGEGRLTVETTKGARFVYLSGRPHGEPIRHRGPFVD